MLFLETDWTAFFLAAGGFVTTVSVAVVAVIVAISNVNKKMDAAATRREQIGTAIIDPAQTVLPPKEQP